MKIHILIAGTLFTHATLIAQNTFPSTGNAGIGTASPTAAKLEFRNATAFGAPYGSIRYMRINNIQPSFVNEESLISNLWDVSVVSNLLTSPSAENVPGMDFRSSYSLSEDNFVSTTYSSPVISVLKLNMDGKVGVGIQNPSAKLHVNGDTRIASLAGTGNRMVVTDANGLLSSQALPALSNQTLSFSGTNLSISDGNAVSLAPLMQTLTLSGNNLSISGGNTVSLASFKDNLGNHTATTNLLMNNNGVHGINYLRFNSNQELNAYTTTGIYTNSNFGVGGAPSLGYNLQVYGSIYCSTTLTEGSDKRFKQDIVPIESALSVIRRLSGVTYRFKKDGFEAFRFDDKEHSGFIAQDVQKVLPHLVSTGDDGYLSLRYTGIIPYLTEGIKEQQDIIEQQQLRIEKLEEQVRALMDAGRTHDAEQDVKALLFQNEPNPFGESTRIRCLLPEGIAEARIILYSIAGVKLKEIPLAGPGEHIVSVSAGELSADIYVYSLIVDGKLVDTKKMVVSR
ncbi:MAG: tail fiber domain-containing protein [Bacteroidia bacterium]|nr:tail fiber domain-containing protein [Bacteroidia bacterium]